MDADLERIRGNWAITSLEMDGSEVPASFLAEARIAVDGDRFTSTGMGATYEGTVALDGSQTPRWITMIFDGGPEQGNVNFGIYEFDGDGWKMCLATRGDVRPSKFVSPRGSGIALETLARVPVSVTSVLTPAAKTARGPATELEGEWTLVSHITGGKAMAESMRKWVTRVNEGNVSTVTAAGQLILKVEFSRDDSTLPSAIDYFNLDGPNQGRKQAGIYEFEDGVLKICMGAPGAERPFEFESNKGDKSTYTVWKRA